MRLVFASNNAHKLSEVRAMMPSSVEVLSLHDIGFEQEIEEDGMTLEANSEIKARTVAEFISGKRKVESGRIDGVFADDTGLEIDALGGKPGVHTARWYLEDGGKELSGQANFAANRAKALRELAGKEDRGCQFRTVITLIWLQESGVRNQDATLQVEGVVRGRMATEEYGEGGFGYDPIFIPEGYEKTFGELPAEIKNNISHRARAMQELVKVLE
jgi:XTP/dITP diphosphohydrolase